ncbi:adenylosuccinate lyase [Candidatus Poriferisocius sp.]|uniref:adenylosuccinate lyase n=1 Tax=Candidatus Poriferisocius sp. TaxID=3101276 RepID=UPI003B02B897
MAENHHIPDVLADRYASAAMVTIWSPRGKVMAERRLWVTVLEAQQDLGVGVPDGVVEAYRAVMDEVDLDSIRERERVTRHDVKARIEEFCALAGHQHIHKGMTSRDLTENIEQLQIRDSLQLVRDKLVAVICALGRRAAEHAELVMVGRSHNVPAQATTLGKRFANYGEEALVALDRLEDLLGRYRLRGLKGPVGTQQDQLDVLMGIQKDQLDMQPGEINKVAGLEQRVAAGLGFEAVMGSVGQVYPRSLDYDVVSALVQVSSAPANLARTIRLMAGHGLISEGFRAGQVGSSAMPGKRNARTCERICGLSIVVQGYADMVASLVGDQWNEGDVSCSVVRRVALPGAFLALDGQLEAALTVLNELEVFGDEIDAELTMYIPDLLATPLLMAAVGAGANREEAHRAITEHLVGYRSKMSSRPLGVRAAGSSVDVPDLLDSLESDPRLCLTRDQLGDVVHYKQRLCGAASTQAREFAKQAELLAEKHPDTAHYQPESIL